MDRDSTSPTAVYNSIKQLSKGATVMATSMALLQAQMEAYVKTQERNNQRKKKTSKGIHSDQPIAIHQGQAAIALGLICEDKDVEAGPSLKTPRQTARCSNCRQPGHTVRTCLVDRIDPTL